MSRKMDVISTGEIGKLIGQPPYRVEHIIRSRHIKPVLSAGGRHFYRRSDVPFIKAELDAIDELKRQRDGGKDE